MGRFRWFASRDSYGRRQLQGCSRKAQRLARFERLEDRLALSCTAAVDGGVLPIEGDDAATTIDMSIVGDAVTVKCEAQSPQATLKGSNADFNGVKTDSHGGDNQDTPSASDEGEGDDEDARPVSDEHEDDDGESQPVSDEHEGDDDHAQPVSDTGEGDDDEAMSVLSADNGDDADAPPILEQHEGNDDDAPPVPVGAEDGNDGAPPISHSSDDASHDEDALPNHEEGEDDEGSLHLGIDGDEGDDGINVTIPSMSS
jgi:hypothetical protein